MQKLLGGDAAGMSTVHEVVTARHCGMRFVSYNNAHQLYSKFNLLLRVLAISMITNKIQMKIDQQDQIDHDQVLKTAKLRSKEFTKLITKIISRI